MGNETRTSILPTIDPGDPGISGPDYDPSDFIPLPGQLGVRRGKTLGHVMNAVKATGYYVDTIGFGEVSNPPFRTGFPVLIYGVNYFLRSGIKCDNGADAYEYVETIPKGDSMGTTVQKALASTGLPQLKGLAPGALEDTKAALNPVTLIRSLGGTGYAKCKRETKLVGDLYGNTGDSKGSWIKGKIDTTFIPGPNVYIKTQTHWVAQTDKKGNLVSVTKDEYEKTPKTYNPDGTPRRGQVREPFIVEGGSTTLPVLFAAILAIGGMAALKIMASK